MPTKEVAVPVTFLPQILCAIRDARSTQHADRIVLMHLCLRCKPREGIYKCWPSYEKLADDCQLDPVTVKRAMKRLVDADLVATRSRSNKPNIFFVNTQKLLHDAETEKARLKAARNPGLQDDEDYPFRSKYVPVEPAILAELTEPTDDQPDEDEDASFLGSIQ